MRVAAFKLLALFLLAGSLGAGWVYMDYRAFKEEPVRVPPEGYEFTLEPGMGVSLMARRLEEEGVIRSARYFRWLGKYEYLNPRVQAGTYRIARGTTPTLLLMQIIEGRVAQYSITLVEGWNIYQVMDRLAQSNDLKHLLRGQNLAQVMTRIGHPGEHPEGRFFPETYDFPKGLSDIAFLQRAWKMMDERLAVEWKHRDPGLPYRNAYEALIMASIVEKETGQAIERPQIAGVFVRRLQKRMLLQTDPTVIYGLGPTFDGNLRRRDLLADNPYNTYRKQGLPPTPIAMPSAEAIHAALHPAPGKDLYFVARGDGSHYFSATLAEHNAAVVRFQLRGQARPFSSSQ